MFNESKSIYIIVAFFIVVLGLSAYFLQGKAMRDVPVSGVAITENKQVTPSDVIKAPVLKVNNAIKIKTATTTKDKATTTLETETVIVTSMNGEKANVPMNVSGAILKTNLGDIEIEFATTSPNTVMNFISLSATKFYDGVRFHRVIRDFMIQTGDPLSKDINKKEYWGTGDPGYKINDELNGKETYVQGTVAMAKTKAPNSGGSQFFIITAYPKYPLDPEYTVFGKVVKGIDTALNIQNVKTDNADRPIEDVILKEVVLK